MPTHFEKSDSTSSPGYEEAMNWWRRLDTAYRRVSIVEFGQTDAGLPIHVIVLADKPMNRNDLKYRNKPLLLINNAIHAGEPDGVDASMMLYRDILERDSLRYLFKDVIIACIPFYNIGGALNRNSYSRANQDGPKEYGFRGNAQNLDLNRDFIKMDSRNARSFAEIIQYCDPDLYVETHVSNGADYPYVMTYLSTLASKSDPVLRNTLETICTPFLTERYSKLSGQLISPYVNVHGHPPDNGFSAFNDAPRYSTGYLSSISIPGYITETHMLKPFKERVMATYHFLMASVNLIHHKGTELRQRKMDSRANIIRSESFGFNYSIDSTQTDTLEFHGYEYGYKLSDITGEIRLFYDRNAPYIKDVPYYKEYKPGLTITKPKAYILKRGFGDAEQRLAALGIEMRELTKDTVMHVNVYRIENYRTSETPYEKHYYHSGTSVSSEETFVQFRKGDYIIDMGTYFDRLIMTILEPETEDSYFNWNFYDAILQQKEWYSSYVFEDKGFEYLQKDSILRDQFQEMSADLKDMTKENRARYQLYWLYQHSPHYEKEYLRYPVFRIN